MIGVLIVAYRPRLHELQATLEAVADAVRERVPMRVRIWHNDGGASATPGLEALYAQARAGGVAVEVGGGGANLGFGRGINALASAAGEPLLLVLNQDAIPEPGSLSRLWQVARSDAADVAAWELRQIPYEHPKDYDPVRLDTGWFSGAAVLLRAEAFAAVGGFEPRIFMYGEDVDLSWRLRCAGWRLRYLPRCAVVHHAYSRAGEIKPLQALESTYANLCIRTRFAGRSVVLQGLKQVAHGLRGPEPFAGWRRGLLRVLARFACHYPYFRRTRCAAPGFEPCLRGWDYEVRREGAFHPFRPAAEQARPRPLVTVVVRTSGRAAALRRLLACVEGQTHRPLEAIVIEAGGGSAREVCAEFADRLGLRRVEVAAGEGADVALSRALAIANGEWIALADDESQVLYADHVEVLLQAALDQAALMARSLAWRLHDATQYEALGHLAALERLPTVGTAVSACTTLVRRDAVRLRLAQAPLSSTVAALLSGSAVEGDAAVVQVPKLTSLEFGTRSDAR